MNEKDEKQIAELVGRQIVLFPAFADARRLKIPPTELLQLTTDAYENEQLTQEQDLILEALLYLAGWTEEFHLREALQTLEDPDYNILLALIEEYRVRSFEPEDKPSKTIPIS